MALITRMTRLLRADLHAVLDRVEEPEALLRQAVREMEASLAEDRSRHARIEREHARLAARVDTLAAAQARIAGELDVCFEAGNESLARALVRRRLEQQRLAAVLVGKRNALGEDRDALAERIDERSRRLDTMRQKLELLAEESRETALDETAADFGITVTAEDVEVAFLRELRERRIQ